MVKDIAIDGQDLEFDFQLGQIRHNCPRLTHTAATFLCSPSAELRKWALPLVACMLLANFLAMQFKVFCSVSNSLSFDLRFLAEFPTSLSFNLRSLVVFLTTLFDLRSLAVFLTPLSFDLRSLAVSLNPLSFLSVFCRTHF